MLQKFSEHSSVFLTSLFIFAIFSFILEGSNLNASMEIGAQSRESREGLASFLRHAIPSRAHALEVNSRPQEKFFEYYVSGERHSCGFRVLGLEREEGIDLLKEKRKTSPRIRGWIENEITCLSDQAFRKIFGAEKNKNTDDFLGNENQDIYLDYLKISTMPLEAQENCGRNGRAVRGNSSGVMDALAFALKKQLYVYRYLPGETKLTLSHRSVRSPDKNHPFKRVCALLHLNRMHFNRLVREADEESKKEANTLENKGLMHLMKVYQSREREEEEEGGKENSDSDFGTELEITSSSEDEDGSSSEIDRSPSSSEESGEEGEKRSSCGRPVFSFTMADLKKFLNQARTMRTLPGMTRRQSLEEGYRFISSQIRFKETHAEKTPYVLAKCRLILEHNYRLRGPSSRRQALDLLEELEVIIRSYEESESLALCRYANYAKIYKGRVLRSLGRYEDAYDSFTSVGKQYTKVYRIDIAEMIINDGFVPELDPPYSEMTPLDYALLLLEKGTPSFGVNSRRARRGERSVVPLKPDGDGLAPPSYFSSRTSQVRVGALMTERQRQRVRRVTGTSSSSHRAEKRRQRSGYKRRRSNDERGSPERSLRKIRRMMPPVETSVQSIEECVQPPTSPSDTDMEERFETPVSGTSFQEEDIEEGSGLLLEGFPLESSENIDRDRLRRLYVTGNAFVIQSDNKRASECFEEAGGLAKRIGEQEFYIKSSIALGGCKYENSLDSSRFYLEALELLGADGNPKLRAQALIGLGNDRHGGEGKNVKYYLEALELLGADGDPKLRAQAHIGLGRV